MLLLSTAGGGGGAFFALPVSYLSSVCCEKGALGCTVGGMLGILDALGAACWIGGIILGILGALCCILGALF